MQSQGSIESGVPSQCPGLGAVCPSVVQPGDRPHAREYKDPMAIVIATEHPVRAEYCRHIMIHASLHSMLRVCTAGVRELHFQHLYLAS